MQERFYESGSCVQKNCAILGVHPIFQGPTGVQNSPNCVAKLRGDSFPILADHVGVDCLRDWRAIRVSESLLTQFLRCTKTAHQSGIRVTEGVEAIASRYMDAQRTKQGSELSFQQQVLIPRRSVASGEK